MRLVAHTDVKMKMSWRHFRARYMPWKNDRLDYIFRVAPRLMKLLLMNKSISNPDEGVSNAQTSVYANARNVWRWYQRSRSCRMKPSFTVPNHPLRLLQPLPNPHQRLPKLVLTPLINVIQCLLRVPSNSPKFIVRRSFHNLPLPRP